MKAVQYWILKSILQYLPLHPAATGFRKDQNVLKNAQVHKNNKYFLCFDIDDFFPSIKYPFVYTIFNSLGYNKHVSHILASLCTFNGYLPQGGVTSPTLSNLCCVTLDRRISGYCGPRNISYTRYADDMTFSSMNSKRLVGLYRRAKAIIEDEHFVLNEAKTRYMGPARRREITGIVVGDGQAGIGRRLERKLRASIYNSSQAKQLNGIGWTDEQLKGWISYMNSVDPNRHQRMMEYIRQLSSRLNLPMLKSRLGID
jgi:retron-type reverse transcriptase